MNQFLFTISVFAGVVFCVLAYPGHDDHHHGGSYKYDYSVHDAHTGDVKQQHEVRHEGYVKGTYSLAESDGTYRIVEYEAEPHKGFNAVVKRIGKAHHPQVYHHHDEPHHNDEHHHGDANNYIDTTHWEDHNDDGHYEHHHDEYNNVGYGGHFDKAESHVGTTHWGHHNDDGHYEHHHDEHNVGYEGHFGDAKSHVGTTHWGHH